MALDSEGNTQMRRWWGPVAVMMGVASLTLVTPPLPVAADAFVDDVIAMAPGAPDSLLVDSADRFIVRRTVDGTTIALTRHLPSGDIDPSFGQSGTANVPVLAHYRTTFRVTPGGSLLVIESLDDGTRIRRLTSAGVLDPTYGVAGELNSGLYPLASADDGTLFALDDTTPGSLRLVRFDANGEVDVSFGTGGSAGVPCCTPPFGPDYGIRIEPDGQVLVIGYDGGERRGHRFDASGTLVASRALEWTGTIVATLPDGSHLIRDAGNALLRMTADLTLDPAFNDGDALGDTGHVRSATISGDRTYLGTMDSIGSGAVVTKVFSFDSGGLDRSFGAEGVVEFVNPPPRDGASDRLWLSLSPDRHGGVLVRRAVRYLGGLFAMEPRTAHLTQLAPDGRELREWHHPYIGEVASLTGEGVVVAPVELTRQLGPAYSIDAVRRFRPLDPRIAPFETVTQFAEQLAQDFAGRSVTPAEIATLEAAIADGVSASEVIRRAADDPYWSTRLDPVARLYRAYFGRLPDLGGLEHWMRRRDAGTSVARISAVFADSNEFRNTYGALSDREFVELVYRNVLGRDGDRAGIDFWTGRLQRRVTSRGHLMASFSESTEHVRRLGPEVATVSLFVGMLGRVPTGSELATWAGPDAAGDEDALARALLAGHEYSARL